MKGKTETDNCSYPVPPVCTVYWDAESWDRWLYGSCACNIHASFREEMTFGEFVQFVMVDMTQKGML